MHKCVEYLLELAISIICAGGIVLLLSMAASSFLLANFRVV